MLSGDFTSLVNVLNEAELQGASDLQQWPAVPHLLALILADDLEDARMLHKRLPEAQKQDAQVQHVLALLQSLWHKQYEETFKILQQTEWPEDVRPLINALQESFRAKMVQLVSKAYSQIRLEKGAAMTGLPSEQLIKASPSFGWTWKSGSNIFKVERKSKDSYRPSNQEQIQRLTRYVAHLED
jgi:hypothetical protein